MQEIYLKEMEKLNEYQRRAVEEAGQYCLLNAAVGSGKTTVLMHKVLYLHYVKKIPLEEMVVLTFTNKAAFEIKKRIKNFDETLEMGMKYFGTFHSIARTILEESEDLLSLGYNKDFSIISSEASAELLEKIIIERKLTVKYRQKLLKRVEEFKKGKKLYGVMKNLDDIDELIAVYKREKVNQNVMDFDDLIEYGTVVLKIPLNIKYVIIDEFQDTDDRQYAFLKAMCSKEANIFAIGDPYQIIYSWRTGTDMIFKRFKEELKPIEMSLPINYRSSRNITEAASALIAGNKLTAFSEEQGSPITVRKHYDAFNEALYISKRIKQAVAEGGSFADFGILYRRQLQGELLKEVFEKEGIPASVVFKKNNTYEEENSEEGSKVALATLHGAKGLEYQNVFIIGANAGNIPLMSGRKEEEEELRLFYVGMTRAKKNLEISYLAKTDLPGAQPFISPYISLIPQQLLNKEEGENSKTLKEVMQMLREERKLQEIKTEVKKASHPKYGEGIIKFENDELVKVEFENYGEKEFSKLFCPLTFL